MLKKKNKYDFNLPAFDKMHSPSKHIAGSNVIEITVMKLHKADDCCTCRMSFPQIQITDAAHSVLVVASSS